MWRSSRIAVVVPAYREERLLPRTLASIPALVDRVVVVDDASPDGTWDASRVGDPRVLRVRHARNRGVGAAIVTGYHRALADDAAVVVVMAGDAQMDPADLPALLDAVLVDGADYAKGNRFLHAERRRMPVLRRAAGRLLAALTRAATGLDVDDTQCGYTALSRAAADALPLGELWPRYGYPNDLLALLARAERRVIEVPVRPIYADEQSGLRAWHALLIAALVARRWVQGRGWLQGRGSLQA